MIGVSAARLNLRAVSDFDPARCGPTQRIDRVRDYGSTNSEVIRSNRVRSAISGIVESHTRATPESPRSPVRLSQYVRALHQI